MRVHIARLAAVTHAFGHLLQQRVLLLPLPNMHKNLCRCHKLVPAAAVLTTFTQLLAFCSFINPATATSSASLHTSAGAAVARRSPDVENQNEACTNAPLTLSGTSGQLVSWNFPEHYAQNLKCAWNISGSSEPNQNTVTNVLRLTFETLEIAGLQKCRYHNLTIRDGSSLDSEVIAILCGKTPTEPVFASGSKLFITFSSTILPPQTGFRAFWELVPKLENASATVPHSEGCFGTPHVLSADSGEVFSWNYPHGYINMLNCFWHVQAKDISKVIRITIEDIDIEKDLFYECDADSLTIYDGVMIEDGTEPPAIAKLCGRVTPTWHIISTGHQVSLYFVSDHVITGRGFHLTWDTIDPNEYPAPTLVQDLSHICGVPQVPITPGNLPATAEGQQSPVHRPGEVRDKIIGGQVVTPGSWPWQVGFWLVGRGQYCGGSLIHSVWVLSAAHCFKQYKRPEDWKVMLGKFHEFETDEMEQDIGIERIFLHHHYNNHDYDIALVKLASPANMSASSPSHVLPICLPKQDSVTENGTMCYVTGWGETEGTGGEGLLKQSHVPVLDRDTCANLPVYNGITDRMLCAGWLQSHNDHNMGKGDSGGPLVCYKTDKSRGKKVDVFELIGVVSWSMREADTLAPGIYVRTSYFVNWIHHVIKYFA